MHERGKTRVPNEILTHDLAAGLQSARYRDTFDEQGYLGGSYVTRVLHASCRKQWLQNEAFEVADFSIVPALSLQC